MSQFDDKELKEQVSLPDLLAEVAQERLNQRRSSYSGLIRILLEKKVSVSAEIERTKKELEKKTTELKAIDDKIEKLRMGDWSVLEALANNLPQSNIEKKAEQNN